MSNSYDESHARALSPEGERRRVEILKLACGEARASRRRRLTRRVSGGGLVVAMVLVAVLCAHREPVPAIVKAPPIPERVIVALPSPARALQAVSIKIVRIETDPTITSRLAIPPQKWNWQKIDDDVLLERLAQAGTPAGLNYADGRTTILYRTLSRR